MLDYVHYLKDCCKIVEKATLKESNVTDAAELNTNFIVGSFLCRMYFSRKT